MVSTNQLSRLKSGVVYSARGRSVGTNGVKGTHRIPWKNDEHQSPTEILFTTKKRARWADKGVGEASVYCILMLTYIAAKALQLNLGVNVTVPTPTPAYCLA